MRTITINAVLNGYVCQVGCQTVVFASRESLILELGQYLAHPKEVEARYTKEALHADMLKECRLPQTENQMLAQALMETCGAESPTPARRDPLLR